MSFTPNPSKLSRSFTEYGRSNWIEINKKLICMIMDVSNQKQTTAATLVYLVSLVNMLFLTLNRLSTRHSVDLNDKYV
jgi:hypothetical protein